MYNSNNNVNVPTQVTKGIIWGIAGVVFVIVAMAFIRPWYNVWSQEMEGKAEFAKAEQNRKIKIEEARANLEAEKLNAQAEQRQSPCRLQYGQVSLSRHVDDCLVAEVRLLAHPEILYVGRRD